MREGREERKENISNSEEESVTINSHTLALLNTLQTVLSCAPSSGHRWRAPGSKSWIDSYRLCGLLSLKPQHGQCDWKD